MTTFGKVINENATTSASGSTPGDSAHTATYAYDNFLAVEFGPGSTRSGHGNAQATTTLTPSTANAFPLTVQASKSVTAAMN